MNKKKQKISEKIILDASALLALLNQEPGFAEVEKIIRQALMSSVNVSEVLTVLADTGIQSNDAENFLIELISEIIPFDLRQAFIAASLRKNTKQYGLSLGDRACLALGKTTGFVIFTADKIWEKLNLPDIHIQLIR